MDNESWVEQVQQLPPDQSGALVEIRGDSAIMHVLAAHHHWTIGRTTMVCSLFGLSLVLVGATTNSAQAKSNTEIKIKTLPSSPRSVTSLVRQYRRSLRDQQRGLAPGTKLRFDGVGNQTVYNPTKPFTLGNKTILAGRVEAINSEHSTVVFFEKVGNRWRPIKGAPKFSLQDPFIAQINGELVFGGVAVEKQPSGPLKYGTVFYRGTSIYNMEKFAEGPEKMKDIRLAGMDDGRIMVLTRPQGKKGGLGQIGYTIIDSLRQLTPDRIQNARLIKKQFLASEWGGSNEIINLGAGKFAVLGHAAKHGAHRDKNHPHPDRSYFPMIFGIDLNRSYVSPMKILLERADLPGGRQGLSKRKDLKNVLMPGGLELKKNGQGTLYLGAGDAETWSKEIKIPQLF